MTEDHDILNYTLRHNAKLQMQNDQLKVTVKDLENQLRESQEDVQARRADFDSLKTKYEDLVAKYEEAAETLGERDKYIEELRRQLKNRQTDVPESPRRGGSGGRKDTTEVSARGGNRWQQVTIAEKSQGGPSRAREETITIPEKDAWASDSDWSIDDWAPSDDNDGEDHPVAGSQPDPERKKYKQRIETRRSIIGILWAFNKTTSSMGLSNAGLTFEDINLTFSTLHTRDRIGKECKGPFLRPDEGGLDDVRNQKGHVNWQYHQACGHTTKEKTRSCDDDLVKSDGGKPAKFWLNPKLGGERIRDCVVAKYRDIPDKFQNFEIPEWVIDSVLRQETFSPPPQHTIASGPSPQLSPELSSTAALPPTVSNVEPRVMAARPRTSSTKPKKRAASSEAGPSRSSDRRVRGRRSTWLTAISPGAYEDGDAMDETAP
ncbi:hypothetical protein HK104_000240 [Borealophlyctis nickersoniae]|nr:hypothetical protein HK104_000240 [Borealophlyctis nickersoniae]